MNAYRTIGRNSLSGVATALLLAFVASAMPPTARQTRLDCAHRYISMGDTARPSGSNNASRVYARRHGQYANLARAYAARRASATLATSRSGGPAGP